MDSDTIIQQAHQLLAEYSEREDGGADDEFLEKVAALEDAAEKAGDNTAVSSDIPTRLLASHCAENYALYTGVILSHNDTHTSFFCGISSLHEAVLAASHTIDPDEDSCTVQYNDTGYRCRTFSIQDESVYYTFITYSASVYFSYNTFVRHAESLVSMIRHFTLTWYDFTSHRASLNAWLDNQPEELFCMCYHFQGFYDIFIHLGINQLETINAYLYRRLEEKYPSALLVYQHSCGVFFVFFSQKTEDRRIGFSYNTIPIPYSNEKILLRGTDKISQIMQYSAGKI